MESKDIELKCDRLKELLVGFVARASRPSPHPQGSASERDAWWVADKAQEAADEIEAVRLGLDLVKQVIVDFHRIADQVKCLRT